MFKYVRNSCGPPGVPEGADIYGQSATANEGQVVNYECKDHLKQVYSKVRTCWKGRWTPRSPKCR
ncbi:unnamed protein product [Medioppia subpectinata]|uniref:Sushi domain-containing protein n=1 Tax=Medioppia subpectinata TaxID=1979941 RepID=A0A7R9Q8N2_9ACAR|nr:unnamed protein product [Medioppia subpectinata]CAG2116036.1 unnamed protein product [Medioppia subpectinata]